MVGRPMAVVMPMLMPVAVVMPMGMAPQGNRNAIGLAGAGALVVAEVAALAEAFDVVVVAVLGRAHFGFEAQHLGPVLAQRAVHGGVAAQHLVHPFDKGVDHVDVVAQIARLYKVDLGVIGGHQLAVGRDTAHQHPRKQEVGEDDDALEAQLDHMAQPRLHQRKGDT